MCVTHTHDVCVSHTHMMYVCHTHVMYVCVTHDVCVSHNCMIYVCDATHSYATRPITICDIFLFSLCDIPHSSLASNEIPTPCVTQGSHMRVIACLFMCHDSCIMACLCHNTHTHTHTYTHTHTHTRLIHYGIYVHK